MAPGKHAGGAGFITADLDAEIQQPGTTGQRFVRLVYAEIKATC
jgi:hypothetical protein